jgi:transcriptional regulator with GAF, ATPase, and Fis domain
LFGHVKGAFTSAIKDKQGKFELADGGTIFLDEIGETSPALQVKLLRVLQNGAFSPVGSESERQCDVRVIAATNRDLKKMVEDKTFRQDLYYRLKVISLAMPPLRDRREDILLLIDSFARNFTKKYKPNEKSPRLSKAAEQLLLDYNYPGNIRELENIMERAVIFCKDEIIEANHLPEELQAPTLYGYTEKEGPATFQERKRRAIEKFERDELSRILTQTRGKVRESARIAGMDVSNFSDKLKRYGIKTEDYKGEK